MTVYKEDINSYKFFLYLLILASGVGILTYLYYSREAWLVMSILIVFLFLVYLSVFRIVEICIDGLKQTISFKKRNYLRFAKTRQYDISNIHFTYKQQVSSLRSGLNNVCTFYLLNKIIAHLHKGNSNWSEGHIMELVNELRKAGVKEESSSI